MRIVNAILTSLVLGSISFAVFSAEEDASKHFVLAESLIWKNTGDSEGATRKGLEEGLVELKLAESSGFKDKAAIYKLEYYAYESLAFVFSRSDSEDYKKYSNLMQKSAEKYLEFFPNDPIMLDNYAIGLQDKDEQLKILRKVVLLDPKNYSARYSIGLRLIELGKIDEAMAELNQALSDAEPGAAYTYKRRAIERLNKFGFKEKADELRNQGKIDESKVGIIEYVELISDDYDWAALIPGYIGRLTGPNCSLPKSKALLLTIPKRFVPEGEYEPDLRKAIKAMEIPPTKEEIEDSNTLAAIKQGVLNELRQAKCNKPSK
jgi:tetratricopeptide (TPR) repeat protein